MDVNLKLPHIYLRMGIDGVCMATWNKGILVVYVTVFKNM
jgi:hypothetical protein